MLTSVSILFLKKIPIFLILFYAFFSSFVLLKVNFKYAILYYIRRNNYAFTGIEMYLETILILSKKMSEVRSIDICEYMGYSKPSVSRAVGLLKNGEYINVDKNGYITLSPSGREVAEKIYERHTLLTQFLIKIGVDEKTATEDACRLEHVISDASFNAIKKHAMGNK